MVDRVLESAKEEQFVLHNWSADGAAELIPFQSRMDFVAGLRIDCREIRRRIQQVVAHELKKVSMELVRAGLRHRADLCSRVLALRGGQRAGFNLEFLQR